MVNSARKRSVGGVVVVGKDLVEGPDRGIGSDNIARCHDIGESVPAQLLMRQSRG
jgi:hypothetical protein